MEEGCTPSLVGIGTHSECSLDKGCYPELSLDCMLMDILEGLVVGMLVVANSIGFIFVVLVVPLVSLW